MGFFFDGGFEIMFVIVFLIIAGGFILILGSGILSWSRNNRAPRLTVAATVVAKRQDFHRHADGPSHTRYYVCFQVESGDRVELSLEGGEYGLLAEGDHGQLSFQGMRYLGFERDEM